MQISNEVLAVLSTLTIDGLNVKIEQQLDRKLYTKVNEVLEACGGKWNRKAKAHVFPCDAYLRIEEAIVTGEVQTHKDIGFFPTPPALAKRLVAMADVRPGMTALEPSAGTGRIVEALLAAGARVTIVERDVKMLNDLIAKVRCMGKEVFYATVDDFMDYRPSHCVTPELKGPFDRVVMNPPFLRSGLGDHLDHVRHAYGMLAPKGVLVSVLPAGVTFRGDARYKEFRRWATTHGDVKELPDGSFEESGTSVRTVVVRLTRD